MLAHILLRCARFVCVSAVEATNTEDAPIIWTEPFATTALAKEIADETYRCFSNLRAVNEGSLHDPQNDLYRFAYKYKGDLTCHDLS